MLGPPSCCLRPLRAPPPRCRGCSGRAPLLLCAVDGACWRTMLPAVRAPAQPALGGAAHLPSGRSAPARHSAQCWARGCCCSKAALGAARQHALWGCLDAYGARPGRRTASRGSRAALAGLLGKVRRIRAAAPCGVRSFGWLRQPSLPPRLRSLWRLRPPAGAAAASRARPGKGHARAAPGAVAPLPGLCAAAGGARLRPAVAAAPALPRPCRRASGSPLLPPGERRCAGGRKPARWAACACPARHAHAARF